MRGLCPVCEKETMVDLVRKDETIKVRGELIPVHTSLFRCLSCREEFMDPKSSFDPLDEAYREYRRRHGMLQPEAIKEFRITHGLTQSELSRLLGWGTATLSRYENGALQDETHEKALRLAMEPRNLLSLIKQTPDAIGDTKRQRLVKEIGMIEDERYTFESVLSEKLGRYEPDILSGYKKMDIDKLFNAILYFCKDGALKTKLNKLLFYSDFKHFKEYSVSITGARYAHLPHGPVPDNFELFFGTMMHEEKLIRVEEETYEGTEYIGEKFISLKSPNLSAFTESELRVLFDVSDRFKGMGSKAIRDFSHEEKGYKETQNSNLISYAYAAGLRI